MVVVTKKRGENTDSVLRRFTKITKEENINWDINKKKFYMKPSLLRKEKQKERLRKKAQMRRRLSY